VPQRERVPESSSTELTEHDRRYYVDANPTISDLEYDKLAKQLVAIETTHPDWIVAVVAEPARSAHRGLGVFPRSRGRFAMLSLDNSYDLDDLRAFYDRVVKGLDGDVPVLSIEPKIDGFGIELTYDGDGLLALAATRGDGRVGEDVTANVRMVKGVPLRLREPRAIVVRGEIYMTKAEFAAINEARGGGGRGAVQEPAQHRRRIDQAAGSQGGREAADAGDPVRGRRRRALRLRAPRVARADQAARPPGLGPQHDGDDLGRADRVRPRWEDKRDALPYELDGLVIKVDDFAQRGALGPRRNFRGGRSRSSSPPAR